MKLSMWMIANRICSLDMELHFNNETPILLKSARRVYATNCVHVYQSGKDSICDGEGNYILLKDMNADQAFEIVQGVFDFYEDWHNTLIETCESKDFRKLIDSCWYVFQNPLLLFDGNCKVLAMSNQYPADSLDDEWNYLSMYGYSSINAIRFLKYDNKKRDFTSSKIQKYYFDQNSVLKLGGISAGIYYQDDFCGRINLLEYERPLNFGDYQIFEQLIKYISTSLGIVNSTSKKHSYNNIFYSLIQGQSVDFEELNVQIKYLQWNIDDYFRVTVLESKGVSFFPKDYLFIVAQIIRNSILSCYTFIYKARIIIITNESIMEKKSLIKILDPIITQNNLKLAISLPGQNIKNINYLYSQAMTAFSYGHLYNIINSVYDIYDYAFDYIIESKNMKSALYACHPDIMRIWSQKEEVGMDIILTFQSYLNHERSIINTAGALYVHRNTVIYRIKKVFEMLHYDLDDAYTRDYMKLSLKVLNLYDKKYTTEDH